MRKLLLCAAAVATAAALAAPSAFATIGAKSSSPPVKLSGKVNNHGTATATSGAITIQQHDYFFSPTFVRVPAGVTSVSVTVANDGSTEHTFTVPAARVDQTLSPGQTMTVTVPLSGKPALLFYCSFHRSLGMQGALFTKPGAKVATAASSASPGSTPTTARSTGSGGYGY